ncbi:PIG-L deacetylase family protein [Streptomyces sp. NPDC088789]|uniref:PIG-L deacetylase family protein n=1 Tax=Streptomyces sp. NPDC088789 TaxID=3365899 RepID=UPI0037FCCA55
MTGVLAVVAHPDDEVIGPGGTLARHAGAGDRVHVLILAEGKTSRGLAAGGAEAELSRGETATACAELGVAGHRRLDLADNMLDSYPLLELARHIGDEVARTEPRIVYTHHTGDLNADHELTARATAIACRPHVSTVDWLLGFSTLSSTEAGFGARPGFAPVLYAPIEETLPVKLRAMRAYASELRDFPHPRSLRAMQAQAELFGAHAAVSAAEAFTVLRGTWRPLPHSLLPPAPDPDPDPRSNPRDPRPHATER